MARRMDGLGGGCLRWRVWRTASAYSLQPTVCVLCTVHCALCRWDVHAMGAAVVRLPEGGYMPGREWVR